MENRVADRVQMVFLPLVWAASLIRNYFVLLAFFPRPNMNKSGELPSINVCGNEVPLPAYWKVVDLWNDGKTNQQIVAHILRKMKHCNPRLIEEIVFHIIDNQLHMDREPANLRRSKVVLKKPNRVSAYRASRMEAQAELAEAEQRLEQAEREEEEAVMRTFEMIRKKGPSSAHVKRSNDPEAQEALDWFQAAKRKTDVAKKLVSIHKSSLK